MWLTCPQYFRFFMFSLCIPGWPWTFYVPQTGLGFVLPSFNRGWDYRHGLTLLPFMVASWRSLSSFCLQRTSFPTRSELWILDDERWTCVHCPTWHTKLFAIVADGMHLELCLGFRNIMDRKAFDLPWPSGGHRCSLAIYHVISCECVILIYPVPCIYINIYTQWENQILHF